MVVFQNTITRKISDRRIKEVLTLQLLLFVVDRWWLLDECEWIDHSFTARQNTKVTGPDFAVYFYATAIFSRNCTTKRNSF